MVGKLKVVNLENMDFSEDDFDKILTGWPEKVVVEFATSGDSDEQDLIVHLGTKNKAVARARAKQIVWALEGYRT